MSVCDSKPVLRPALETQTVHQALKCEDKYFVTHFKIISPGSFHCDEKKKNRTLVAISNNSNKRFPDKFCGAVALKSEMTQGTQRQGFPAELAA